MQLGLQLDLEVDVLAAPPCGGGGSQIIIRYSIATGLRAFLLAVDDSRWAGLGRLRTRGVDYSASASDSASESEKTQMCDWDLFNLKSMCSQLTTRPSPSSFKFGCATGTST